MHRLGLEHVSFVPFRTIVPDPACVSLEAWVCAVSGPVRILHMVPTLQVGLKLCT
jgi:hypothetical protein